MPRVTQIRRHAAARHRVDIIAIGVTPCNEIVYCSFISNQGRSRLTERTCFTGDRCFLGGVKPPLSETIQERITDYSSSALYTALCPPQHNTSISRRDHFVRTGRISLPVPHGDSPRSTAGCCPAPNRIVRCHHREEPSEEESTLSDPAGGISEAATARSILRSDQMR